jgi:molybdopterin-binding protein
MADLPPSSAAAEAVSRVFRVDPADPAPVHAQLARRIRVAVADGTLKPGEALPSVRGLARTLAVSANTVGRAYAELSREGVVVGRAGGGTVVAPRDQINYVDLTRQRQERLETLARQTVVRALAVGLSPDEIMEAVRRELARHGAPPRSTAHGLLLPLGEDEGPLLSARNRVAAQVEHIRLGELLGEVTVALADDSRLVVAVTRTSIERLGLREGKAVTVLVKATEPVLRA